MYLRGVEYMHDMNIYFGACAPDAARKCNICIYLYRYVYTYYIDMYTYMWGRVCQTRRVYVSYVYKCIGMYIHII